MSDPSTPVRAELRGGVDPGSFAFYSGRYRLNAAMLRLLRDLVACDGSLGREACVRGRGEFVRLALIRARLIDRFNAPTRAGKSIAEAARG